MDQLSRYFTKQEEENFALFSYVNELSYEVEVLSETVQHIRDDIGIRITFSISVNLFLYYTYVIYSFFMFLLLM